MQSLDGATLVPASKQGALLVVGQPGDRLVLDGAPAVSAGVDGVAQLQVAPGVVEATVVGGGRRVALEVAVSRGHGSWVRVEDPTSQLVSFGMGERTLDADDEALLDALVADVGGWSFTLRGGFSAEGDRAANLALAADRAEAVRQGLLARGLAEARVTVLPPAVPEDASTAAARRVCTITPVPATLETPQMPC